MSVGVGSAGQECQSRELESRVCMCAILCVRQINGEWLWVDEKNAIYNGKGSGIDQYDYVL